MEQRVRDELERQIVTVQALAAAANALGVEELRRGGTSFIGGSVTTLRNLGVIDNDEFHYWCERTRTVVARPRGAEQDG